MIYSLFISFNFMKIKTILQLSNILSEIKTERNNKTFTLDFSWYIIKVKVKINKNVYSCILTWESWVKKLWKYDKEYTLNTFYKLERNLYEIFHENIKIDSKDNNKKESVINKSIDNKTHTSFPYSTKPKNENNLFSNIISLIKKIMFNFDPSSKIWWDPFDDWMSTFVLLDSPDNLAKIDTFIDDNSDNLRVVNLSDIFDGENIEKINYFWQVLATQLNKILKLFSEHKNFFEWNNIHTLNYAYSNEYNEQRNSIKLINTRIKLFEWILSYLKESWAAIWSVSKIKLDELKNPFNNIDNLIYNCEKLKMHDFFEIYVVLKKIIDENLDSTNIFLSINDNFRLCYIEKNWKVIKFFARKVWNIWLDFNEIDFISYDSELKILDIYDAKFYSSDISKTSYEKFYSQLTRYKNKLSNIISRNYDDLINLKNDVIKNKGWYLKYYVGMITDQDLKNEVIYRKKLKTIIWNYIWPSFQDIKLKLWLGDIKFIIKNMKLKISSSDKKIIIEDVFDNFKKIN